MTINVSFTSIGFTNEIAKIFLKPKDPLLIKTKNPQIGFSESVSIFGGPRYIRHFLSYGIIGLE